MGNDFTPAGTTSDRFDPRRRRRRLLAAPPAARLPDPDQRYARLHDPSSIKMGPRRRDLHRSTGTTRSSQLRRGRLPRPPPRIHTAQGADLAGHRQGAARLGRQAFNLARVVQRPNCSTSAGKAPRIWTSARLRPAGCSSERPADRQAALPGEPRPALGQEPRTRPTPSSRHQRLASPLGPGRDPGRRSTPRPPERLSLHHSGPDASGSWAVGASGSTSALFWGGSTTRSARLGLDRVTTSDERPLGSAW